MITKGTQLPNIYMVHVHLVTFITCSSRGLLNYIKSTIQGRHDQYGNNFEENSQCLTNKQTYSQQSEGRRRWLPSRILHGQAKPFSVLFTIKLLLLLIKCAEISGTVKLGNEDMLKKENGPKGRNSSILASTFTAIMIVCVCVCVKLWRKFHQPYNSTQVKWWFFYNNQHELMQ